MEDELKRLINLRKTIKSKFTKTNNTLTFAISQNNHGQAQALYDQLCSLFNEDFFDIHNDLTDLLSECESSPEFTETHSKYVTVNGKTADEYFISVKVVFEEAVKKFSTYTSNFLLRDISDSCALPMEQAKQLVADIDDYLGTSSVVSVNSCVLQSAKACVTKLTDLHERYVGRVDKPEYQDKVAELKSDILELSCRVTKIQARHASDNASGGNFSIQNSEPHIRSPTSESTPSLSAGSAGDAGHGASQQTLTTTMLQSLHEQIASMAHGSLGSSMAASRYKKPDPPVFSGDRKDWSDFKANWEYYSKTGLNNDFERASALRSLVRNEALETVRPVPLGAPNALKDMWERLEEKYSDVSLCVQAVYDDLKRLKPVGEQDACGLVRFVNQIEEMYARLNQIGIDHCVTMVHIDEACLLLPAVITNEWEEKYYNLSHSDRLQPFSHFIEFLSSKRSIYARRAERQRSGFGVPSSRVEKRTVTPASVSTSRASEPTMRDMYCVVHTDTVDHRTPACPDFAKLSLDEKYKLLKKHRTCFCCLRTTHIRPACDKRSKCSQCSSERHHYLLCDSSNATASCSVAVCGSTGVDGVPGKAILGMCRVESACVKKEKVTVFFDSGSDSSFITHRSAKRVGATKGVTIPLNITKVEGCEAEVESCLYSVDLFTARGERVTIQAFGLDSITGPVTQLSADVVSDLFPSADMSVVDRGEEVDMLLGNEWLGFHPREEIFRAGDHLFIKSGVFGSCIMGSHPRLVDSTRTNEMLVNSSFSISESRDCKVRVHARACLARVVALQCVDSFVRGEDLGIEVSPRCGGCKCGKCPVAGCTYSFKEEQELRMIRENLEFDEVNSVWRTSYPWIRDPSTLPDNYSAALATLCRTECNLRKDDSWASTYHDQIMDMVARGVARKLSAAEVEDWAGPVFYISHLAVSNPKSKTTPVRIVFNSSQTYQGVSLNSALAKGPDSYINNLLGVLLRWREEHQALVADIRKMFNSIYVKEVESHCHRFLWRDLDSSRPPDIYVIQRVNMGDRPAGAISTEAVYKTASMFQVEYPQVAVLLTRSTYVDDIVDSVSCKEDAVQLACDTSTVLGKAGFKVKAWHLGGEARPRIDPKVEPEADSSENDDEIIRVLGVLWCPVMDEIRFEPLLNFSDKRKGVYVGQNLTAQDIPEGIPMQLTRRIALEQSMKIFDPYGLLCPFTLLAKLYLRETWSAKLSWDEALPGMLREKWVQFFTKLWSIAELRFGRCLKPEGAVGTPVLALFSDGSEIGYGCAAYIRWKLEDGSVWCRLIMAKARIAPMNRISIPQMELNGAVVSKRVRAVIESEMRYRFERVFHFVDSETVLSMINKVSTKFKVYEGVRVGEIQASCDGSMGEWFWIPGDINISDWLTRGKFPDQIDEKSRWWLGPSFLYEPLESWPIKSVSQLGNISAVLPGEKKCVETHAAVTKLKPPILDYSRYSSVGKVRWVVARVLSIIRRKSFQGGRLKNVSLQCYRDAEQLIVMDVQRTMGSELEKRGGGQYRRLHPILEDNRWVVGSRVRRCNPLTVPDAAPQILLPSTHPYTRLCMVEAHELSSHRGRDATVARFRHKYWAPQGTKIAKSVSSKCMKCRMVKPKAMSYPMGALPLSRLCQSNPFSQVMVDIFGPYVVKDNVRKRTRGKVYGVLYTDLFSRAVHVEVVYGYDADSFLRALLNFTSVRGWPEVMYSDPGSQIVCVEKELRLAWITLDRTSVYKLSIENGTEWKVGPGDSPWYQGAVESLIKGIKLAIKYAMGSEVLSGSEFETVCKSAANVVNERPLGTIPSDDSDISILTPNSLLLGRATAMNPGISAGLVALGERRHIVADIASNFWNRWRDYYAPTLFQTGKSGQRSRNLQPGDLVVVMESNPLRQGYYIARVKAVHPSGDGIVRRVDISYRNFRVGKQIHQYKVSPEVVITRGVKNLGLLLGVDEL